MTTGVEPAAVVEVWEWATVEGVDSRTLRLGAIVKDVGDLGRESRN